MEDWSVNWSVVAKLLVVLLPFKEASEKLSSSHASLADVIPVVNWLSRTLNNDNVGENQIQSLTDTLRRGIRNRFSDRESNTYYIVATLLDPRYKNKAFSKVGTHGEEVAAIEQLCESSDISTQTKTSNPKTKNIKLSTQVTAEGSNSFHQFIMSSCTDSESESEDVQSVAKEELRKYMSGKRLPITENMLNWWKVNVAIFPNLAIVARKFLSPPATSVPSEQLFKCAGLIYESTQNSMLGETAEKLLFLKYNLPVVKFMY